MVKWTLLGGLLALVGITGLTFANLLYALIGLGVGLMMVGILLEIAAVVLERAGRRWGGVHHHGFIDRLHRPRPYV